MKEWDTDQKIVGKMFYDCMPTTRDFSEWLIKLDEESEGYEGDFKVGEDIELMEFTGLVDKTGKEIFGGDVVYLAGYGNYEVKWPFRELFDAAMEGDIGEIKGNIFENPELLNDK